MDRKEFNDLNQTFPIERKKRHETWEEFCEDSKNLSQEERQDAFRQQVLGNPLAKKIIGEGGPDKNASYIGFLAAVFGVLGIHDLNCGNIRNGVLKLIFTCTGCLSIISFVWTFLDLFKLGEGSYKAANGIPLGSAPWCKTVAVVEAVLFATLVIVTISFFVFLFTETV